MGSVSCAHHDLWDHVRGRVDGEARLCVSGRVCTCVCVLNGHIDRAATNRLTEGKGESVGRILRVWFVTTTLTTDAYAQLLLF